MQLVAVCREKNCFLVYIENNLYAEIMVGHKNDWTGSE